MGDDWGGKAGKCAEIDALSQQAAAIRKKLGPNASDKQIREALREEYRKGAKIEAFDSDGTSIPPCKFCAQVMRELGIHPDNIDANPTGKPQAPRDLKGGVQLDGRPWKPDKDKDYDGGNSTVPSTTPGKSYNAPEDGAGAPPPPQFFDKDNNFIGPRDPHKKSKR
jgi:hypothetical protein